MLAAVLASLLRRIKVDLVPAYAAHFLAARTEQEQQPNDGAIVVLTAGFQDADQFSGGQDVIARCRIGRPMRSINRVCAVTEQTVGYGPSEERGQSAARGCGGVAAVVAGDGSNGGRDIGSGAVLMAMGCSDRKYGPFRYSFETRNDAGRSSGCLACR